VANPDPNFRHNERCITPHAIVPLDLTSESGFANEIFIHKQWQDPAAR